jgi:hypothetical protein
MTDVVLSPIRSGHNLSKINSNFKKIEDKINDEIFHRIGGNNIMQQNVDMNNNDIINTNSIYATEGVFSTRILLGGTDYEIVLQNIADAAQVSADASAVSAAESEASAVQSANSAVQSFNSKEQSAALAAQVAADVSGITIEFLADQSAYDMGYVSDTFNLFPTDLGGLT